VPVSQQTNLLALPGQIYRHPRYYHDATGWHTKYLLVLAANTDNVVYRLLTSRAHARPEIPPCYHGDPYPGFYLGLIGGSLSTKSWLDLRRQDDYDRRQFSTDVAAGLLTPEASLSLQQICAALDCAANADDTTRQQTGQMRDQRALLGCM
jgi:hypothetical protein